MRSRTVPLNTFGLYLTDLCDRAGLTLYEVGLKIGIRSRSRMSYVTRAKGHGKTSVMPISDIRRLAKVLGCDQQEESKLVLLGALEHAPPILRSYLAELEREVASCRKANGKPPPRIRLST